MVGNNDEREYDLVIIGATGFTGRLTAQHIARHLPGDLRWAIAGRSQVKLEALKEELEKLDPKRLQPKIETVALEDRAQVLRLVKNAKLCISVVLYFRLGHIVIDACVEARTDYVDTNGDTSCVRTWIDDYHKAAEDAGVILIVAAGTPSAPHDLMVWALVQEIAHSSSSKTREVILDVKEMIADPSGGTMESLTHGFEDPSWQTLAKSEGSSVLSPIKRGHGSNHTNILGMRYDPNLGSLAATSFSAAQDQALINRTWALLEGGKLYGENFEYNEYQSASTASGIFKGINQKATMTALSIGPVRDIIKKSFPPPGEGPAGDADCRVELRAVGISDPKAREKPVRALASLVYPSGGSYRLTALFLAQTAASLLYKRAVLGGAKGGILTPAFLAPDLIERAQAAGVKFSVVMV